MAIGATIMGGENKWVNRAAALEGAALISMLAVGFITLYTGSLPRQASMAFVFGAIGIATADLAGKVICDIAKHRLSCSSK